MVAIAKPNDDPYSINEPKPDSTIQGTIYEIKKKLRERMVRMITPLGVWRPLRWVEGPPLESLTLFKIRPCKEETSLTISLHKLCRVSLLLKIPHLKYNEVGILFISEGALENKNEG